MKAWLVGFREDHTAARPLLIRAKSAKQAEQIALSYHRAHCNLASAKEVKQTWPDNCMEASELKLSENGIVEWSADWGMGTVMVETTALRSLEDSEHLFLALDWDSEHDGNPDLLVVARDANQAREKARALHPDSSYSRIREMALSDGTPDELPYLS